MHVDDIKREEWDNMKCTMQAMIEIASTALKLNATKWWEFNKRKKLFNKIELIRSCYNLKPLSYL